MEIKDFLMFGMTINFIPLYNFVGGNNKKKILALLIDEFTIYFMDKTKHVLLQLVTYSNNHIYDSKCYIATFNIQMN